MNIAIEIQKYEDCYEDGYKHFHHKTIFFGSKKNGSDYSEEGMSILGLWTPAMYEQQWREGLERITKEEYSCLVISIEQGNIDAWILHKVTDKIHITNDVIFGKIYKNLFEDHVITPENCYQFLLRPQKDAIERVEDAQPERWVVSLTPTKSAQQYYQRLAKRPQPTWHYKEEPEYHIPGHITYAHPTKKNTTLAIDWDRTTEFERAWKMYTGFRRKATVDHDLNDRAD